MLTLLSKYAMVWVLSMVKFIFGILAGVAAGLSYLETALLTIGGMMTTVIVLTFLGASYRKYLLQQIRGKNYRVFTPRNRKIVRFWRKYGVIGITMLTPLLFTPIGGTLIALAFGENKYRIIRWMLFSATLWSFVLTAMVFYLEEIVLQYI